MTQGVRKEVTVPINRLKAKSSVNPLLATTPERSGPREARTKVPLTFNKEKEINTITQLLLKYGTSNDMKAMIRSSTIAPPCLTPPTNTFAGMEKTRN